MTFQPGDRVRWDSLGDDGLPLTRYGFVGGFAGSSDTFVVMLDGDVSGDTVIDRDQLAHVHITNVEVQLSGVDILDDSSLRRAIVNLWSAEADQAGLEIASIEISDGEIDSDDVLGFALAKLRSAGENYVLRASVQLHDDTIMLRVSPA